MNFEISARGIELTDALRARVERRLRFALGDFEDRINRVRVVFWIETGQKRGHNDNCCRIQIAVRGRLAGVLIEQADSNVEAIVDWAADRVGRAVARRLDRDIALLEKPGRSEPRKDRS